MNKRICLPLLFLAFIVLTIGNTEAQDSNTKAVERVFVFGGDINLKFVRYVVDLTEKENPRICYLPTASGDNQDNIKYWEKICNVLKIESIILKVWVSSSEKNQSFEEVLLNSDAIIVGGGNTLNMLGIWKAQGIDVILRKALKKGIILAGGSAGSICWFKNGISDSRPVNLSIVDGLAILPYSNCPHFSQEQRRALYYEMIEKKKMAAGYASDELAGILFKNGKAVEYVSQSDKDNSYFVSLKNGKIQLTKFESKILLKKNSLPENSYTSQLVKKKIVDLLELNDKTTPLNAYISMVKSLQLDNNNISESERSRVLNIGVEKVFCYDNKIAGVVNDAYLNSFGYGMWYFYNSDGNWISMGEDIGGATVFESEITFREKAEKIILQAISKNQQSQEVR